MTAAVPLARAAGLDLICGIELSTRFGGASVHLLGYFPCAVRRRISGLAGFLLASRRDRNRRLIGKLQSLGVDITLAEVETKGRSLTGRPHFARVLVEKGYAKDIQNAFDEFLDESARGYVQRHEVRSRKRFRASQMRAVFLAGASGAGGEEQLGEAGKYVGDWPVWGCRQSRFFTAITVRRTSRITSRSRSGWIGCDGGSDFHGGNKPMISLGTGMRNNLRYRTPC
jgi:hypothetical protein